MDNDGLYNNRKKFKTGDFLWEKLWHSGGEIGGAPEISRILGWRFTNFGDEWTICQQTKILPTTSFLKSTLSYILVQWCLSKQ